ncbi:MAG TPA: UDP-N-acetylmuramoyl-tripeptide--D-alanyl-D-alanine ligase [Mycobacteriales bacterium]|nr:UDP-N-acetylmuramoyl-tripeptide--D-alanyl-D-alanine ligase [Mycobacteriales bacterium]
MIDLTLLDVATAVGGVAVGDVDLVVRGPVLVDSRSASPGALFAAVVGEHADGHDFAAAAAANGAVAALTTRPLTVLPCVVVDDVVAALSRLAGTVLSRLREAGRPRVVGVTGSTGKTSTKDLLAQVLAPRGETVAPVGSYNNEIGLPLTVLRASPATEHLVLEMSARGLGHITALCQVAPLDVGVVLNVGSAHVGEFGSRAAIATAKAELVAGVVDDGVTVLNADDDLVAAMRSHARGRVVTFGCRPDADVAASGVRLDDRGRAAFRLESTAGSHPVSMQLVGEHHVANALAAAAAAIECGVPPADVAASLSTAVPLSRWRMEMRRTSDGVTVINDAYNANPESMQAALRALVRVAGDGPTWAVLGMMAELGAETDRQHALLGELCAALAVSHVVVVGAEAAGVADAARRGGVDTVECPDVESAVALLEERLEPGDTVLVKASRSVGLERVAEALAPATAGEAA